MVRAGLLVALLSLVACSGTPPASGLPGEGGSGPSDGGSGGTLPIDETPPTLEWHTPEDGAFVDDPEIVIEGIATDETGVEELRLIVDQGLPVSIQYTPGRRSGSAFPSY